MLERRPMTLRRTLASLVVGALGVAACGDGESDSGPPAAESVEFLGRDLGDASVAAASNVATNPLPDLVVDNVSTGGKVNVRNVLPADKPVLLWMWAPH